MVCRTQRNPVQASEAPSRSPPVRSASTRLEHGLSLRPCDPPPLADGPPQLSEVDAVENALDRSGLFGGGLGGRLQGEDVELPVCLDEDVVAHFAAFVGV